MQTFRLLRYLCVATLPIMGAGAAATAWASDEGVAAFGPGYSATGAPVGAPTELQIDLRGEVRARCRMTSPPALPGRLDFNHSGVTRSRFALDCNAPFSFSVRSGHGGFASRGSAEGVAPLIPYEIAVDVDTDSGMNALGWCRSGQLADSNEAQCAFGPQGWSSGD
ncbi:MAG TPA: hypothetical protein VF409_09160, partial [Sphingomonas sp.]